MGSVIGAVSPSGTTSSYSVVDVPSPGVVSPVVVNNYTTLAIPSYYRALDFKSANMASFPRSVHKNGVKVPHRLDQLLKIRPNTYQSCTMLFRTWHFHTAHYANGFVEIERDTQFAPKALHNRPPEIVAPFRWMEDDGTITGWYWIGGMRPHIASSNDIMHNTGLSYDGMSGLNPVWIMAETFERSRMLDRYVTRFLVKGSVVRGSIEIPVSATQEQIDAIIANLQRFRGADAEEDLIALTGGAKLSNAGLSNEQSQLIQLRESSDIQIAQLTGVHPHFLYADKNGKYNNSPEQAGEDIVRYTFRLLIEQSEDEMNKLLTDEERAAGYCIHIDPAALLRGDIETQSAIAEDLKTSGIITTNEARADLKYPQLADPAANKVATLGDTAPKAPGGAANDSPKAASRAPSPSLESFTILIGDAANRVSTKTAKATDTAQKKHNGDAFTRWGNVFAEEQSTYAIEQLAPILQTIEAVIGQTFAKDCAQQIGSKYAEQLRVHYSRLVRAEESTPPDLQTIAISAIKGERNGESV